MLEELGCKVDTASTAAQALNCTKTKTYNFIFMDISLPDMDGIMLTQKIRKQSKKYLPIIALTAHALDEEKEKFKRSGLDDVVTKPVSQKQLYDILKKYIAE